MGIKRKLRGSECKKYRGKGISSNKHSLYKDTHRNGFNDTISHEVSPIHITITLTLEGFLSFTVSLGTYPSTWVFYFLSWLAHLIGLDEGPPIFKLSNSHEVLAGVMLEGDIEVNCLHGLYLK
jgi:hypothetical protein